MDRTASKRIRVAAVTCVRHGWTARMMLCRPYSRSNVSSCSDSHESSPVKPRQDRSIHVNLISTTAGSHRVTRATRSPARCSPKTACQFARNLSVKWKTSSHTMQVSMSAKKPYRKLQWRKREWRARNCPCHCSGRAEKISNAYAEDLAAENAVINHDYY